MCLVDLFYVIYVLFYVLCIFSFFTFENLFVKHLGSQWNNKTHGTQNCFYTFMVMRIPLMFWLMHKVDTVESDLHLSGFNWQPNIWMNDKTSFWSVLMLIAAVLKHFPHFALPALIKGIFGILYMTQNIWYKVGLCTYVTLRFNLRSFMYWNVFKQQWLSNKMHLLEKMQNRNHEGGTLRNKDRAKERTKEYIPKLKKERKEGGE